MDIERDIDKARDIRSEKQRLEDRERERQRERERERDLGRPDNNDNATFVERFTFRENCLHHHKPGNTN
jgi:hypothetical protein